MTRKIIILPKADNDLFDIWIYGYWQFGETVADEYNTEFTQIFAKLAFYDLGRKRPDLGEQVYALPVNQHIIIYRATAEAIIVGRVLHHSQNMPLHITDEKWL